MMKLKVVCDIKGENFDPYAFKIDKKNLIQQKRKGEINKRGRPYSFGFCEIKANSQSQNENVLIRNLLKVLNKYDFEVGKYHIKEINFLLTAYYTSQCNFELNPSLLGELGKRKSFLLISSYKVNESDLKKIFNGSKD
jgi:hypothetical protein